MSIDLDVFPTTPNFLSWGKLKTQFLELLTPEDVHKLGTKVSLLKLGSNEIVRENEKLSIDSNKKYSNYYLSLEIPNTIGVSIHENESNYINEFDYLEDYGRNLDIVTIKSLSQKWKSVGYGYGITSMAGRSKWEPPLFIALAAAIAHLCEGYVIVMNDNIFTLNVGVYTPEEFQKAKMKSYKP